MALTDEQIDAAHDVARRTYRHSQSGIRGQQMMPSDDPDWHFARAIESAACAERDARIAKLTRALEKAERTLTAAGYTDEGGDLWKPPLGPSASPLLDHIAELERQLAEARKDAERYQWLRDVAHPDYGPAVAEHQCNDWGKWYYAFPSSTELDAAIDNAMQKG